MPKSVLVVEDDPLMLDVLRRLLTGAGYEVELASSVTEAQRKVQRRPPSVAVVDVNLGDESGLDLVRVWRISERFPVLVLSGLGSPMDRVVGLELGADDYLVKPFEPRELVLRLRLLLERRRTPATAFENLPVWTLGAMQFDERKRCLRTPGEDIALSTAEFKLISYLLRHANRAVSREQILAAVQHRDRHSSDRAVDVLIGRLRKKIAGSGVTIEPIRGLGYMLCGDVTQTTVSNTDAQLT
jgi:DNA-binding response OmpR family regulator